MFNRHIQDNEYKFPTKHVISTAVQQLIQQILTSTPSLWPTLHEIVDHLFFTYIGLRLRTRFPSHLQSHVRWKSHWQKIAQVRITRHWWPDRNWIPPFGMPASMVRQRQALLMKVLCWGNLNLSRRVRLEEQSPKTWMPSSRRMNLKESRGCWKKISRRNCGWGRKNREYRVKEEKVQEAAWVGNGKYAGDRLVFTHNSFSSFLINSVLLFHRPCSLAPTCSCCFSCTCSPCSNQTKRIWCCCSNSNDHFRCWAARQIFRDPKSHLPLPDEWASWVDYCNKYRMGYSLRTNGSVGVHNDSTICSDTALRRSDMALLGIVCFIFGHLITHCYLTKHI